MGEKVKRVQQLCEMQKNAHPFSARHAHTYLASQSDQSSQNCLLSSAGAPASPSCTQLLYSEQIETICCKRCCQCLRRTQVNKGREPSLLLMPSTARSHCCSVWTGKKQERIIQGSNVCDCLYPFLSHIVLSDFNDTVSGQPLDLGVIMVCLRFFFHFFLTSRLLPPLPRSFC